MSIEILNGRIFTDIQVTDETITFVCSEKEKYLMYHCQNCCESVCVEDIIGDIEDIKGSPVIRATENTSSDAPKGGYSESHTWTFYDIATAKGSVTIRWYGESNGYYSESVEVEQLQS